MIGIDAAIYYSTGTYASPTWVELTCVGDCALNAAWDSTDVMVRASRAAVKVKTMLKIEIQAKLLISLSGDTGLIAIQAAMNADTQLDFLVLSKDTTVVGARGYRFWGQVNQLNESQNPGDVLMDDCIISPTIPTDGNWPKLAIVGAGPALGYTAIGA